MSVESSVINTSYTKPVLCIKDFESMTLEEQQKLIDYTFNSILCGLFPHKYSKVISSFETK